MGKSYRGGKIMQEPPPEGWGLLWMSDAYTAQVGEAKIVEKNGQELVRFYLSPFEALARRFNIDRGKDLDSSGYCYRYFPKEMVRPLNTYDPSRRIFFSLLDWNGQETENSKWFLGKESGEKIIRLKREIRELRAHNEKLRADNFLMKVNVQKYIKENMADSLQMFMPAIRSLVKAESGESGS